jgi:hypothetical protein
METVFWDHIPSSVTKEEVLKSMGMPVDHMYGKYVDEMIEATEDIVNLKAVIIEFQIKGRTDDSVTIGEETFVSKTLAEKFSSVDTVYAYLATCGREIEDYSESLDNIVNQYALEGIMAIHLRNATIHMTEYLDNVLDGQTFCVSPGSFEDWPLAAQHPFFALMGEYVEKAGICLSDSGVMRPGKSVSGFRYRVEKDAHDCRLCLKRDCIDRNGAFDPNLYEASLC